MSYFGVCVSERFPIGELSHLSKSSSMPLCKACPDCGGMVHIRKVNCSCGHVFVAKHNKHLFTPSRKHTLRSIRAIETDEKATDRRSVDKELVKQRRER